MTNIKATKRALLISIMSLFLCSTMLLGTTFAWFTDEATSSGNKIVAGTLTVDLEVLEELDNGSTQWVSVKENHDPIFNYTYWEPGYTEVKILRVVNEGNLALKWKAMLTSNAALSDLAKVIDMYVKEDVEAYPADRAEVATWTYVGTLYDYITNFISSTVGEIPARATENDPYPYETLAIAFKMQESAGNEYQALELGAFDIRILATQLANESDSFGPEYDENAEFAQ